MRSLSTGNTTRLAGPPTPLSAIDSRQSSATARREFGRGALMRSGHLDHTLGLGVDADDAVHVDINVDLLARRMRIMRMHLAYH